MTGRTSGLMLIGVCDVVLAEERTVIVPNDEKPFAVGLTDFVRLRGKGIAGAKIAIKIDGPAELETTSIIRELVKGRPLIGGQVKEFDLKPTEVGKVSVTITVTAPQPNSKVTESKYEFEVK